MPKLRHKLLLKRLFLGLPRTLKKERTNNGLRGSWDVLSAPRDDTNAQALH